MDPISSNSAQTNQAQKRPLEDAESEQPNKRQRTAVVKSVFDQINVPEAPVGTPPLVLKTDAMDIDAVSDQASKTEQVAQLHFFQIKEEHDTKVARLKLEKKVAMKNLQQFWDLQIEKIDQAYAKDEFKTLVDLIKNRHQDLSQALLTLLTVPETSYGYGKPSLFYLLTTNDWNQLSLVELNHFWEELFSIHQKNRGSGVQAVLKGLDHFCFCAKYDRRILNKRHSFIPSMTNPKVWKDLKDDQSFILSGYYSYVLNSDVDRIFIVPKGIEVLSHPFENKLRRISIPQMLIPYAQALLQDPQAKFGEDHVEKYRHSEALRYLGWENFDKNWDLQSEKSLQGDFDEVYQISGPIPYSPFQAKNFLANCSPEFWKAYLYIDIVDTNGFSQGIIVIRREDYKSNFPFLESLIPYESRVELVLEKGIFSDYVRCFKDIREIFSCTLDELLKLFTLADQYQRENLSKACEERLIFLLNKNNLDQIFDGLNDSIILAAPRLYPAIEKLFWAKVIPNYNSELHKKAFLPCDTLSERQKLFMQHCFDVITMDQFPTLAAVFGPYLKTLHINEITEENLTHLESFTNLQTLKMGRLELTPKVATSLSKLSDLTTLECSSLTIHTEDKLPSIKYLKIYFDVERDFKKILSVFPSLISTMLQ